MGLSLGYTQFYLCLNYLINILKNQPSSNFVQISLHMFRGNTHTKHMANLNIGINFADLNNYHSQLVSHFLNSFMNHVYEGWRRLIYIANIVRINVCSWTAMRKGSAEGWSRPLFIGPPPGLRFIYLIMCIYYLIANCIMHLFICNPSHSS
jgi:hypothetical protein